MGGEESKEAMRGSSRSKTQYRFFKTVTDRRYGNIKLMKDPSTNVVAICKDMSANERQALRRYIDEAEVRRKTPKPSLQQMLDYLKIIEEETCGDLYKISFLFEYIENDLDKEIQGRSGSRSLFPESFLMSVLNSMVDAGTALQQFNIAHGDFTPWHILVTQQGEIKLSDPLMKLNGMGHFEQLTLQLVDPRKRCFLSPTLFRSLQSPTTTPNHNQFKSDVFTLGMSLLEAATLESVIKCYDVSRFEINASAIQELLGLASTRYTPEFVDLVAQMLLVDEYQRPDFLGLGQLLMRGVGRTSYQQMIPQQPPLYSQQQVQHQPLGREVYQPQPYAPAPQRVSETYKPLPPVQTYNQSQPMGASPAFLPQSPTPQTQVYRLPPQTASQPLTVPQTNTISNELRDKLGLRPHEVGNFGVNPIPQAQPAPQYTSAQTPLAPVQRTYFQDSRPIGTGATTPLGPPLNQAPVDPYTNNVRTIPGATNYLPAAPLNYQPGTTPSYQPAPANYPQQPPYYPSGGSNNSDLNALDAKVNAALQKSEDTLRRYQSNYNNY